LPRRSKGPASRAFIVSKVKPENSTRAGTIAACERSLKRLKTDRIDLYLLHWRGRPSLEETLAGFEALRDKGAIRYFGVSNFDVEDMEELFRLKGGNACASNQVVYNLRRRGIEYGLVQRTHASPNSAAPSLRQETPARSSFCEHCHHRVMRFRCWMQSF
jgi:diketogulonate reductase-like aldo/keto reductase